MKKREQLLPFLFFAWSGLTSRLSFFLNLNSHSTAARNRAKRSTFCEKFENFKVFLHLRSRKQRRFGCQKFQRKVQLERRGMQDLKKSVTWQDEEWRTSIRTRRRRTKSKEGAQRAKRRRTILKEKSSYDDEKSKRKSKDSTLTRKKADKKYVEYGLRGVYRGMEIILLVLKVIKIRLYLLLINDV